MSEKSENRAVSQAAIARKAGVARTTVSLALRGGEGLNPETIRRVMEAAETLGYRPNNLVHAIRSGRTRIVGVMVPPHDSYWSEVLHGIHDGLIDNNYVPLALWARHRVHQPEHELELRQIERLADWRVDGAILWPTLSSLYQGKGGLLKKRVLPVVTIDSMLPESYGASAVLSDETLGAQAVAGHLREQGHREILVLSGPVTETWSRERSEAFATAMKKGSSIRLHNVELPMHLSRTRLIREAMEAFPAATAIYCATDAIAEEVYGIAAETGKRIPRDLSVVGYGAVDFGSRLDPPLTTVRHRPYRMGLAAAEMVVARIEAASPAVGREVRRLPVELVVRDSTGPPLP